MTTRLQLTLPAVPASVRDARNAVADLAAELGFERSVVEDVRLCVSEAATNVVRHAYKGAEGEMSVVVDEEGGEFVVAVRDEGVGLSDFRHEGDLGYGLRIIEIVSDRCNVSSAPQMGTQLEMTFLLSGSEDRSAFTPAQ
jgi:serine/threonine-protein kinase RsbW